MWAGSPRRCRRPGNQLASLARPFVSEIAQQQSRTLESDLGKLGVLGPGRWDAGLDGGARDLQYTSFRASR